MPEQGCALPDEARREQMLLSRWYRMCFGKGDRLRDEKRIGESADPITGIVKSRSNLKSAGEALRGPELVFSVPVMPDRMALENLQRDDGTLLCNVQVLVIITLQPDPEQPETTMEVEVFRCKTSETARIEEELARVQRDQPEWKAQRRLLQGQSALEEHEAASVAMFKYLWEKTLRDFASKGWVALEPPTRFEPMGPAGLPSKEDTGAYQRGTDDKGGIFQARVLPAGLDEALKRIAGDPHWSRPGPFSSLEGSAPDVKVAAMETVSWAHKLFLAGE